MFNGHFYEEGGEEVCREFLNSRTVVIVIDPPFGGLVEVLAKQVHQLWSMAGKGVGLVACFLSTQLWLILLTPVYTNLCVDTLCVYIYIYRCVHLCFLYTEVSTVLVFPYFMEQHVSSALPSLNMCDYQVGMGRQGSLLWLGYRNFH